MKNISLRKLTGTALCIALGLVTPMVFHAIGLGSTFLPMHLPVLLCGLCFGPWCGLVCGVCCPILSSVTTGMPPLFPTCVTMVFELATYGFVTGLLYRVFKKNIYLSLVVAMVVGRIVGGAVSAVVYGVAGMPYTFETFMTANLITSFPGILLQLVLVPVMVIALEKGKVISNPKIA